MAIAIDGSSPAIVTNGSSNSTTASFTAPDNSLLVALICYDGGSGAGPSISNTGGSVTWTQRVNHQIGEDAGANGGTTRIYTAPAATSSSRTVTAVSPFGGSAIKVLVLTGVDLANPAGATGEGHSTTANLTVTGYTSTVAASRGVAIASDSNGATQPTSSDTGFGWSPNGLFGISGIAVYKATDSGASGASVSFNFNGTGGTRAWNWCALEITGIPDLPRAPLIISQAVNRSYFF